MLGITNKNRLLLNIRSKTKMKQYAVITRPFHREHEPSIYIVSASSKKEASDNIFSDRDVKEILNVELFSETIWNAEAKEKYWKMYK
jgi:hypothetical protein